MRIAHSLFTTALFGALATNSVEAQAQSVAPPTFQEVVDEFGFVIKTGRFTFSLPPILSVGGADGFSVSYAPSGGRSLVHNFYREIKNVAASPGSSQRFVTIQFGQLSETFLGQTPQGPFTAEYPTGSSLVWMPAGYLKYTDKNGMEIHFETFRTRVTYPDGRELIVHGSVNTNNGTMVPTALTNNFGYMIKFDTGGLLQAVNQTTDYCSTGGTGQCTALSRTRTASTQMNGSIKQLTDAAGKTTIYRFREISAPAFRAYRDAFGWVQPHETHEFYLAGITFPDRPGEDVVIDYGTGPWDSQDGVHVKSITRGDAKVDYEVSVTFIAVPPEASVRPYELMATARVGGITKASSRVVNPNSGFEGGRRYVQYIRDGDGFDRITGFSHNQAFEIASKTFPEGNGVANHYDGRNNVISSTRTAKQNSGLANIVSTWTYAGSCTASTQATCNLPLTYTDGRQVTTDFTYNSRGQLETEIRPAATPGAARPKTTYTYTMRTAYIKDASGATVAAGPAISMLTSKSACPTSNSCTGTTDEVLTGYDYGPTTGLNALRLRGITVTAANASGQIQTLRTCYTYNYFGERISETKPKANLGSCS